MASQFSATQGELQNYLKLAEAAMRAGDMARAFDVGRAACNHGIEHPNLLVLGAYAELNSGDSGKALSHARRAKDLAPQSVDAMQALALALAQTGQQKEALSIYDGALRKVPGSATLRYYRARLLEDMLEVVRARLEFERVLELDPRHAGAMTRLAAIAVANGEIETARAHATRALKLNPSEAAAFIVLAQADLQEKKYDQVITRMTPLTAPQQSAVNRSIAHGLIADALDATDKKAEAFSAYAQSNRILKDSVAANFEGPGMETVSARARRTADAIENSTAAWASETPDAPVKTHVFLLGFPRSGTTLLENVLASHPAIETMEERDGLLGAEADYMIPADGLDRLRMANAIELARYRDAYWSEMETGGAKLDRDVFIDKMPLNSLLLPVIAKLFPQAKILLAIRDPSDVVLSCFRRRFGLTAKMYPMLSLDSAANYYDAAMHVCMSAREKFSLPFRATRYEDLVLDFEAEARSICGFIGVEYDPAMTGFAERAKSRLVNTPSATQVSQGLYTQGIDQWRAYRDQMTPAFAVLAPWVKEFGYAEE